MAVVPKLPAYTAKTNISLGPRKLTQSSIIMFFSAAGYLLYPQHNMKIQFNEDNLNKRVFIFIHIYFCMGRTWKGNRKADFLLFAVACIHFPYNFYLKLEFHCG